MAETPKRNSAIREKKRTESSKLASDVHVCPMAQAWANKHPHPHKQITFLKSRVPSVLGKEMEKIKRLGKSLTQKEWVDLEYMLPKSLIRDPGNEGL